MYNCKFTVLLSYSIPVLTLFLNLISLFTTSFDGLHTKMYIIGDLMGAFAECNCNMLCILQLHSVNAPIKSPILF